jgi:enterochelin esterase family protein
VTGFLRADVLDSQLLHNSRRVWLQAPTSGALPQALCLLLDGEYYVERMDVGPLLADLQAKNILPPLAVACLSHIDGVTRWPESFCNPTFARFVREEAVPFAAARFSGVTGKTPMILGGLSLTGLAAVHAALVSPDFFAGVFSQSGAFWWNEMKLAADVAAMPSSRTKFRLACGSRETTPHVQHGRELIQCSSQLTSNQALRDALLAGGFHVDYVEYDGGHDLASWKEDLPRSLAALLC